MPPIQHILQSLEHLHQRITSLEARPQHTTDLKKSDIEKMRKRIHKYDKEISIYKHSIEYHKNTLTSPDLTDHYRKRSERYLANAIENLGYDEDIRNGITLELVKCLSGQDYNPDAYA